MFSILLLHHHAILPPRAALLSEFFVHFSGSLQQLFQISLPLSLLLQLTQSGTPFCKEFCVHSAADLDFFSHVPIQELICFSPSQLHSWFKHPSLPSAWLQSLPQSQWDRFVLFPST